MVNLKKILSPLLFFTSSLPRPSVSDYFYFHGIRSILLCAHQLGPQLRLPHCLFLVNVSEHIVV